MRVLTAGVTGLVAWLISPWALAQPPGALAIDIEQSPGLGIAEHHLDAETELTGWRLNHAWYLGHRDGDGEDGLSLVWQGERRQVSISTEEIRFTRRF